ncbi:MAG: hypothetical protein KKG33_06660 [candidate division Zixibacteria bacterium]|nr:hypothetical protein [candidate division Zixibacteria bacterium]MBU1469727.1 hypothetical protein [candidate division Zixibacteria bacterium]MBU2625223.1 hypothetical protein [candidate division Zixibacteria bacterium]
MTESLPDILPAESSIEPTVDYKDLSVGLPRSNRSLLLTFELCENMVFWTAVRRKQKKGEHMYRGSVELGYEDIDELAVWFEHFWKAVGDKRHEIHIQVSGPELQQRSFMIPVVPKSELNAVVRSEAKRVFPLEIDKGLFGWKVIGKVDWAGGMKYHVYSLLLGENWILWLTKLFGEHLHGIALVTANGQMYECNLNHKADNFAAEDSYLTRLKLNVVETAFFHEGRLEFYREVPVDSLTDGGTVGDLKRIVGMESNDASPNHGLVSSELKTIMRDAIDYYQGQFGQRSIKTAYISMPSHLSEEIGKFVTTVIGGKVVDLSERSSVREYCRRLKIADDISDCSQWMSIYPCRKINSSIVNLVPKFIMKARQESRIFKYSLVWCLMVLLSVAALTIFKYTSIVSIEKHLIEQQSLVEHVESAPVLQHLSGFEAKTVDLQGHLATLGSSRQSRFRAALVLLSSLSRESVRLNTVNVSDRGTGGSVIGLTGEVVGPNEKQEAELYMYVSGLRDHPMVEDIKIGSKRTSSQLAVKRTLFSMEVVTR